jgi:hypothetical protein
VIERQLYQLRGRFLGGRLVQYFTDSGRFLAWKMLVDVAAGDPRVVRLCAVDERVVSLVQVLGDDGVYAQVAVLPLTLNPVGCIAHRIRFGLRARETTECATVGPSDAAHAILGATA